MKKSPWFELFLVVAIVAFVLSFRQADLIAGELLRAVAVISILCSCREHASHTAK